VNYISKLLGKAERENKNKEKESGKPVT